MKQLIILLLGCLIISCNGNEKDKVVESTNNPFFNEFNEVIDFSSIDGDDIDEATELIQIRLKKMLETILAVDNTERTFDNTMLVLDDIYAEFGAVSSPIYLMSTTHPDSIVRSRANASNIILGKYDNELSLNEDLYKAMKSYSLSDEAKKLTGYKAKFLKDEVESAERNGFALSKEDRDKLKIIKDELSEIGNTFNQNIASY